MPATIFKHPGYEVKLQDPRDPPVTEDSITAAIDAANAERRAVQAQTGVAIPLHVRALKGELPPNTCCACGCHIPLKPLQTSYPLGVLYGDPHLAVTRAMAYALEYECGPAVQELYEALGSDERLMVARQLSRKAVSAHLSELAK